jgi:hypothetical protein
VPEPLAALAKTVKASTDEIIVEVMLIKIRVAMARDLRRNPRTEFEPSLKRSAESKSNRERTESVVLVSEVNALSTFFITEVKAFAVEEAVFNMKVASINKVLCTPLTIARRVLATVNITFVKNVRIEVTVLTTKVLMALITTNKPSSIVTNVETMKFTTAVITETRNFLIEVTTLMMKVEIATQMAITPFLMERRNFLIALTVFTKKVVMARVMARTALYTEFTIPTMKLSKLVIMEITNFLIEATILETKAAIEFKMAMMPFLMVTKNLLITEMMLAKKVVIADITARKARPREAIIEAINLTKSAIMEAKNFLIEERIFENKAVI